MKLSTMRDKLRKRIGNPSTGDVPDADLTLKINEAGTDIFDRFRFHQARKLCTFATVSGTTRYGLPTDCAAVLRVRDETNGIKIEKMDDRDAATQERSADEVSGLPTRYIRQRSWIMLDPNPDGVYTIELFYKAGWVDLALDADEPVLPAAWHEGIIQLARHKYFDEKGDIPKAQYALSTYQSWLSTKPIEVDEEKVDLDKGVRIPSLATARRGFSQEAFDRE